MLIALIVASPAQVCGPLSVIAPVAVTEPVKALNGAANESAQPASSTEILALTNDGSQCWVTFQAPLRFGQLLPFSLPASLPVRLEVEASDELEAHAPRKRAASRYLVISVRSACADPPLRAQSNIGACSGLAVGSTQFAAHIGSSG